MPSPLLQEGCGRIWNKLQWEKKHKSLNVLLALWIVCLLTVFLPFLPFPCHLSPHSSHLEREYDLFQWGMPALGTTLGTDWKAMIWIDNIYPCFKFIWTNLAQATGNRQRKWVEISLKEIHGKEEGAVHQLIPHWICETASEAIF